MTLNRRLMIRLITLPALTVVLSLTACKSDPGPMQGQDAKAPLPEENAELPLLAAPQPVTVEPYVVGLAFPTRMAWGPDSSLYIAEKGGAVRVITPDGVLQPEPVIQITVNQEGEQGLLGLTPDPTFEDTGYMWAFYSVTHEDDGEVFHRVGRFQITDGVGDELQMGWEFRDSFQDSTILNGGDVKFGPDGMLYVSAGSTNNIISVNDPGEPQGKIHRFTPTIPMEPAPDNPEPGSSIYARGFRNTYAITFHPVTGIMYGSENGPDCDDEINRILPGKHYGWRIDGLCEDDHLPPEYPGQFEPPITNFTPTLSPTGITFYTGDVYEIWNANTMFFCVYKLGKMFTITLAENGVNILGAGVIDTGTANCAVDVSNGPDGLIYFTDIAAVYRLIPVN